MKRKTWALVSVLYASALPALCGQQWSGLLAPAHAIDWSTAGVPGGIPARTTNCATISASTYGNGSSDATAGIQAALNSCASGQTVSLSAGTFRVNSSLSIPSNVTMRGAGADQTILSTYGTSGAVITMGSGDPPNAAASSVNITSGNTSGSTSIVVANAANFTVGGFAHITEINDPTYVTTTGGDGSSAGWSDGFWNGTRIRGQIVQVTSTSGTTIGISPGLYSNYGVAAGTSPAQALPFQASVQNAGVENLQLYANNTGYSEDIVMSRCMFCWIKGVEANYVDGNGDYVWVLWGFHDEIRDSYFSNAYQHTSGGTENQIILKYKTSASKIENNIFERTQTAIEVGLGAAGNVIGYNYSVGGLDQSDQTLLVGVIGYHHEPHSQFNLYEGNVTPFMNPDSVWGSHSANTFFRNWSKGTARVCLPLTGRGTVNCSGSSGVWASTAARAIDAGPLATSMNFVGNILGSAEQSALAVTKTASLVAPSNRGYTGVTYGATWGYATTGDSGTSSLDSTVPYTTAFLHGNYNNIDGSLVWASGVTHSLPASLYLSAAPAWFGRSLWPAIGPDVNGGGPGNYTSTIPAQNCYASMGGTDGGAGSPYKFNASTCYSTQQQVVAAPTSLSLLVH